MKIIIENTTCSTEIAKKMGELIKDQVSIECFEDANFDKVSSILVLCSLNCNYDIKTIDEAVISTFVSGKIRFARNICQKAKENGISTICLIVNFEIKNTINEMIAKIIKDIFEHEKDTFSINVIETNVELMANSNYARMRFGYTERFTQSNIDKIMTICTLIESPHNHVGVVYNTLI